LKQNSTIRDVARRAQVGVGTVSRVLSNSPAVAEETRRRVQQAMKDLHYLPNTVAGSLASRRTRIVGMLVPTLSHSMFSEMVDGATECLTNAGFQLMIGNTSYSDELEEHLITAFLGRRPEGLILTGSKHTETASRQLRSANIPIAETWELPSDPVGFAVGFSNFAAAAALTRHLVDRGYRRIVMLAQVPRMEPRNDERIRGYTEVVRSSGLEPYFVYRPAAPEQSLDLGARGLHELRARYPDADAVFCADDIRAAGLIFECQRLGIAVPGKLAVAGFGDFPVASVIHPRLTTVRIPGREIGRKAADLILRYRGGAAIVNGQHDLGFELVSRETT
jgi:LacI family gluconate utilization system Gnt-I transcriptional repressor